MSDPEKVTSIQWEQIRRAIAKGDKAQADSDEAYREAGRLLIAMKAAVPHGAWLPTLEREGIGHARASRLMGYAQTSTQGEKFEQYRQDAEPSRRPEARADRRAKKSAEEFDRLADAAKKKGRR